MIAPDVTSNLVQFLSQAAARREAARDPDGAVTLLREAMTLSPSDLALKRRCAKLLGAAPLQAAELWRAIIAAAPGDAASWSELGVVESTLQRRGEAVRCFMRAVELAPADPALRSNLAVARLKADDPPGSEADSRIAIALDPRPEFLGNLGHALVALARFDEAFEVFTRALRLNPRLIDAMIGISRAYMGRGETEKAAAALHRALELDPENAFARSDLSVLLTHLGERGEFASPPPKVGRIGQGLNSNALLAMQYDPDCNKSAATRAALDWGFAQVATTPPVNFQQSRQEDPERRLRVGYVSADFYRHPVGWMGVGPILAHDRAEVEVFLYANNNSIDFITEDLQRGADGFARVRELDDDALAAQIVADRVDILVDLSGHTSGNRLAVFARRPAPVQISWLGYFATTGPWITRYSTTPIW